MNNNPEAGPLHAEQNNAPAIPHMNPLRHSSGYGQPLYPYTTGYNAYGPDYGMSGFNTYASSYGLNPPMHSQGPVPAPSNLSSMNDRMTPPYASSTMHEDSTGYNTSELQSQSLTQRIIETHITAGANQAHPTALNANATLHNDVSREPRGNVSSTTRRHTNGAVSGQRPSYSPEVDVIMTPGEILEARRIAAVNNDRSERARRRYGTLIQPGNPASPFVRGSPQNTNADQTRAAQAHAEEQWQIQHYLHQVRAHDRLFALAQSRDFARLEVERAQRVVEASKPKGLDDQNDGRPPPKESEELTVSLECKVCMSQLVDTVVLPCGHAVMCRWCARQHMPGNKTSAKCPVCRVNIKVKTRIYIA